MIGGEPASPRSRTSQPAAASTWWRAAARQVTCAIWQPVDERERRVRGDAEQVLEPLAAISSTTDADGPSAPSPAFWSQIDVSQSAASAAGSAPPMTNPK